MRTKVTLVLVFLNVAMFFFIFKFERGWRTESARLEDRRRVLGAETSNIQTLDISGPGIAQPISLVKRTDRWYLAKPFTWPANPFAVSQIINNLQLLEHKSTFNVADLGKGGQSLADYGLDKPRLLVTFASGAPGDKSGSAGAPATLRIGLDTPDGTGLYVLSPDGERVQVVGRDIAQSLTQPIEKLRDDSIFTMTEIEVRSFNIQKQTTNVARIRHEGERWSLEVPITARASAVATKLAIRELNALRVKRFDEKAPPGAVPEAGALRAQLEGDTRTETLLIGSPVTPPVPGTPAGAEIEYYARKYSRSDAENAAPVFVVSIKTSLLDTLRNAQDGLRDRRVLDFDPSSVSAVAISSPGSADFKLQRLESSSAWQVVRQAASQGPQQSADAALVLDLLRRLARMEAVSFTSDAPQRADLESWGFNRPERVIAISLAGEPAKPRILRLGLSGDRSQVYARVDGADYVYEVNRDAIDQIPAAASDYRERVLRELPDGAHVTGVRLLDNATGNVIASQEFAPPAAGAPAATVPDLLPQLRTLRAKRFLADPFAPDRVAVDGEDRPWKYRLEISVASDGGAAGTTTAVTRILISDRLKGTTQLAGSDAFGAVWELEQSFIDALAKLAATPAVPSGG